MRIASLDVIDDVLRSLLYGTADKNLPQSRVDATNVGPNVIAITSTRKAQTPATMKYHIGTIVETVFELYPARKFVHRNSATSQNTITATGAFHVFSHFA